MKQIYLLSYNYEDKLQNKLVAAPLTNKYFFTFHHFTWIYLFLDVKHFIYFIQSYYF